MHSSSERNRLFYGWWVVGACFFIALYGGGIVFFGFTAIFEPIAHEFGWNYAQISFAASLRGVEIGILAPLAGLVVDRWGPRKFMFGGGVLVGLGLFFLSRISSLGMFYGAFVLIAVGVSGLSGTVLLTAVVNWFQKRVAIATGIVVSGFALGGLMIPVTTALIDKYEWRTAMFILALATWGTVLPLSLVVRHKPEQYGYVPDGEKRTPVPPDKSPSSNEGVIEDTTKMGQAKGTFWLIATASMCYMLAVSAVVTHVMPFLTSVGISRSVSSLIASATPIVSIGGRLGFGWLSDIVDKRKTAALGLALMAIGLLFFGSLTHGWLWMLVPFIIIFGIGWGGSVTMRATLLREYFGRTRFGTVYGFVIGIAMLGNIAGPPLAGWIFDKWGTYQWAWFVLAFACLIGLFIVLSIPSVHKKSNIGKLSTAQ